MKLKSIDHHRNGICGLPFHVLIVEDKTADGDMLVFRFPKETDKETGNVACVVFSLAKLDERNIAFFENSWRGDNYADFADECIARLRAGKIKSACEEKLSARTRKPRA